MIYTIESHPTDKSILVYSNGWVKAHWNSEAKQWVGLDWDTSDTQMLNNPTWAPTHWTLLPDNPNA